jgi:serine/threonine protein kinase
MADFIGQQLGNYRLTRLLGRGGFADVYLGDHIYMHTQAAIKVLYNQLTPVDIEQFRLEAQTVAKLDHPHIVRVLEFGMEGSAPFLVMTYAPNGTLRQRHPRGTPLLPSTILEYVKQVASALQYAHEQKLIHRDVKPENMLLGQRNEVLLSDFGIALPAQTSRSQRTQEAIGTIAYMAPEQIQGKPRPASDQYSLGIVVYEWISGSFPFPGQGLDLYGQHLYALPAPLREKVPSVPVGVEQVVMTALAKDHHQRFPSIQDFAKALEQALVSPTFTLSTTYTVLSSESQEASTQGDTSSEQGTAHPPKPASRQSSTAQYILALVLNPIGLAIICAFLAKLFTTVSPTANTLTPDTSFGGRITALAFFLLPYLAGLLTVRLLGREDSQDAGQGFGCLSGLIYGVAFLVGVGAPSLSIIGALFSQVGFLIFYCSAGSWLGGLTYMFIRITRGARTKKKLSRA